MTDLKAICPVCDNDIVIPDRTIKIAVKRKADTGGRVLLTCPECCRVLVPEGDVPAEEKYLTQWIVQMAEDDNWLPCIPMLDPMHEKMPTGYVSHHGVKEYRSGAGDEPLTRRAYMLEYGIDPECSLKQQRGG